MNRAATAYHEAGHAVVAISQCVRVKSLTINPGDGNHGLMAHSAILTARDIRSISNYNKTAQQREKMEKMAIILQAGPMAQRKYAPRSWRYWHGTADYDLYGDIMIRLGGTGKELDLYCQLVNCWTKNLIDGKWWQIEKMAEALLDRETVTEQEIREVLHPDMGGLAK